MSPRLPQNLIIGPVVGHFVSCTVTQTKDGFCAAGEVATSEAGLRSGAQLTRVELGPLPSANLAQSMLISQIRWQIENRSGSFATLATDCTA